MKKNFKCSLKNICIFIIILFIIICFLLFYNRYNRKLFINTSVLLPIGNKNETLFFSTGIDHRGIFVYNLDDKRINKIIKNKRTKKNDNNQLKKIFDKLLEGQFGYFNDIEISEYIDKDRLTSDEMYYIYIEKITKFDTKYRLTYFELYIIDVDNNKIYEIYSS